MEFKDKSLSGILRSLVADEFLAWASYYFYEIISQGKALNFTNKIFEKNGKDELEDHYKKLVTWMQSKNIAVPTGLTEMQDICNTPYHAYQDPTKSEFLVQQMITAENEAIDAYVQAMVEPEVIKYPDLVVMLGEICNDEREHLKELEDVRSQIMSKANFSENIKYQIEVLDQGTHGYAIHDVAETESEAKSKLKDAESRFGKGMCRINKVKLNNFNDRVSNLFK